MAKMRTCLLCMEKKPAKEFIIDRKYIHGRHQEYWCAECVLDSFVNQSMSVSRGEDRQSTSVARARKLGLPAKRIPQLDAILWDIQDGKCLYCQRIMQSDTASYDHIIPLNPKSKIENNPGHSSCNIALACLDCNISKKNELLESWVAWRFPDQRDAILARVSRHIEIMRREAGAK